MTARLFHCPLCAADVPVVMWHTGYCPDCYQRSIEHAAKRDAVLAAKVAARQVAVGGGCS